MFDCSLGIMHLTVRHIMYKHICLTLLQQLIKQVTKSTGYISMQIITKCKLSQAVKVVSPSSSLVLFPFATRVFPGTTWLRVLLNIGWLSFLLLPAVLLKVWSFQWCGSPDNSNVVKWTKPSSQIKTEFLVEIRCKERRENWIGKPTVSTVSLLPPPSSRSVTVT